jgi:hypothetical protein
MIAKGGMFCYSDAYLEQQDTKIKYNHKDHKEHKE